MSTESEIRDLEERLRQAELGPDPTFFEEALANEAVMVDQLGRVAFAKAEIVQAHQPGGDAPKFKSVEMRDLTVIDHGDAAVVTCIGTYEGEHGSITLRFLRVWLKRGERWQVIAGCVSS